MKNSLAPLALCLSMACASTPTSIPIQSPGVVTVKDQMVLCMDVRMAEALSQVAGSKTVQATCGMHPVTPGVGVCYVLSEVDGKVHEVLIDPKDLRKRDMDKVRKDMADNLRSQPEDSL